MQTGLWLNALICFIITGISIWTFKAVLKNRKKDKDEDTIFAFFLLFVGITWLFVGLGLLFFKSGSVISDLFINKYAVQPLIFIHLSLGIAYACTRIFKKRWLTVLVFLISLGVSAYALSFIMAEGGLLFKSSTFFSVEYHINSISWKIFQPLISFGLLLLIYDIFRLFLNKCRNFKTPDCKYLSISSAMLMYAVVGYFDNQGVDATWIMVLFRLVIIMSIILAYTSFSQQNEK